jgi:hypothetical protein
MKTIEAWAVVRESGNILVYTESEARRYAKECFGTAVKLTGEVPEPKKHKLMAPALAFYDNHFVVSNGLYSSEMQARNELREMFRAWPAVQNADGFYEVME